MNDRTVQLAITRLSIIAYISIVGLVLLPFAPADTTVASTVLSTVIGGAVAAVAGITVPRPQQNSANTPPRPPT